MTESHVPVMAAQTVEAPEGVVGLAVRALAVLVDLADAAVSFDPAALAAAPEVLVSTGADGRVTIETRRRRARGKAAVPPIPEPGADAS
jgi:hypothetical protein